MNAIQTAAVVVGLITAIGTVSWAGLNEVWGARDYSTTEIRALEERSDAKYVPLGEWQDFQWTQLKRELRELEKDLAEAEFSGNEEFAELLEDRYAELLEFICRKYPDDRECQ